MKSMEESLGLAEAAASDKSAMQDLLERMFSVIRDISKNAMNHGQSVQSVAQVTGSMRDALAELNFSAVRARQSANRIKALADQFQVTQHR